jgi:hypothetical protein
MPFSFMPLETVAEGVVIPLDCRPVVEPAGRPADGRPLG